jgi:cell division septation protein DedD
MIYLPSLGSKEAAQKKVDELSQVGVKDFFIIQDQSNLRWGISLGVFKSEETAKQFLATLKSKGINAKAKARTMGGSKFDYVFKDVNRAEKLRLEELAGQFAGQQLKPCTV